MAKDKKDKALVAAAGVHYVAFKLSSLGYATGLTAPGVENVDLLAANPRTLKSISIQVKTAQKAPRKSKGVEYCVWPISKKLVNTLPSGTFFIIFVDLRGGGSNGLPDAYIVPSKYMKNNSWVEIEEYPKPPKAPTAYWCNIDDVQASNSKNRWDLIP
ncbi:MAG: hypothetical protein Q7K03_02560 [Dehalococcoidia bacterium]|nr:hypothetical protein [Dehalococcoidia bacterium]